MAHTILWVDNDDDAGLRRAKIYSHCARVSHQRHLEADIRSKSKRQKRLDSPRGSTTRSTSTTGSRFSSGDAGKPLSLANAVTNPPESQPQPDATPEISESCARRGRSDAVLVAWKGNSDPFKSQPVQITPKVNRLLNFLFQVWLPALDTKPICTVPADFRIAAQRQVVANYVSALGETWSTYAILLPCATMLARLSANRELYRRQVKLKLDTISGLRAGVGNDDVSMWRTQSLFINAITECQMDEAKVHGHALYYMMRSRKPGSLAIGLVDQVVRYDVYRAELTMTPSVFEIEWLQAVLRAHTPNISDLLEHADFSTKLDSNVRGTPLEECCTIHMKAWWLYSTQKYLKYSQEFWIWVTLQYNIIQLQAANYYVDAPNHMQACLALGLMLAPVTHIADTSLLGRACWPRSRILIETLEWNLSKVIQPSAALLFAAWTSATATYKEDGYQVLLRSYSCRRVAELLNGLDVRSWDGIVEHVDRNMPIIMVKAADLKMSRSCTNVEGQKWTPAAVAHMVEKHFAYLYKVN